MNSKKKVGLTNLNSNIIELIANKSNLKFTETAKLNLTNNNRERIRIQKIKDKINKLNKKSRELKNEINEARGQDRLGYSWLISQNKKTIDNESSILKKN